MKREFLDGLIDLPSFNPKSLKFPAAWAGHLPFAAWLINELSPNVFVELGTHTGNSYFSFCQIVQEKKLITKCFAVDTWQGDDHAGAYGEEIFEAVNEHHESNYSGFSRLLRMTFDEAVNAFPDHSIDLLHIDGLHTYEAVKHDFETWLPKMSSGGIILFHDTNVRERGFGVWKLWDELIKLYPHSMEFVHSHGLGVLQVSPAISGSYCEWLHPDFEYQSRVKKFFASLGDSVIKKLELDEEKKRVQDLEVKLFSANKNILSLQERLTELGAEANHQHHIASRLASEINALLSSNSWRITKPFRFLSRAIKKIYQSFRWLYYYLKSGGNLVFLFKKFIFVYRRGGLTATIGIFRNISRLPVVDSRKEYIRWLEVNALQLELVPEVARDLINAFSIQPKISIVLPTYNSNTKWLSEAIESVKAQIYENWELCIADDASTAPGVRELLLGYANDDVRIKVELRKENGHISQASNSALCLSSGDWVGLLDHDDLLTSDALFWVAQCINNNPDAKLIYSDEDKIDEVGALADPYFKPDWNRELFYGHNLICHFGVYSKSLLEQIGGFRVGFEGAQDYDLALRCIEHIPATSIRHIPRILYHWRTHAKSTAKNSVAKPYAMRAGERALKEHFIRQGIKAEPELIGHGYRIRYQLPKNRPLVSLIIPTRNGLFFLKKCVESILAKTAYENYEILIVDNDSDDLETLKYLDAMVAHERVEVIRCPGPFNYSELNNRAADFAKGEIIGLLNNDIEVIDGDWLSELVSRAALSDVGAVGPKLLYGDGSLQHAGIILGIGGWAGHSHKGFLGDVHGYAARVSLASEFSAVTGACLVVRKEIFIKVGGLDAENLKISCNDVDFCLKVNALGYRNVYTPFATLYHHESATRGYEDTPEKKLRFKKELRYMLEKWGDIINNDPMYSPNLTLDSENFGFAWPTRVPQSRVLSSSEAS